MMYDTEQRRVRFINMNGLMDDPMKVYKDRQVMNMWSEQEKDTFREKYVVHTVELLCIEWQECVLCSSRQNIDF